jgi:hypothetical protein
MIHLRSSIGLAVLILTATASIFVFKSLSASDARDLAVSCGADHRAVVRQAAGQSNVSVDCVPAHAALIATPTGVIQGDMMPASPQLMPAVYNPRPAVMPEPAAPVRKVASRSSAIPVRKKVDTKRSWQRRALVIGGSAGAGAGIGALVGGKKGALIGAAVGGGSAAVVDLLKR